MNRLQDEQIIPSEIIIYYSKWKTALLALVLLFILGVSIYYIRFSFVGVIILILGTYSGFKQLRAFVQAITGVPQIMLNGAGIQTISTPFYKWAEIKNEKVMAIGGLSSGRASAYYLTYDHPNGTENLRIGSYNTTKARLSTLLIYYRIQSKNNNEPLTRYYQKRG